MLPGNKKTIESKRDKEVVIFINRFFVVIVLALMLLILILGYLMVLRQQYAGYRQRAKVDLPQINNDLQLLQRKSQLLELDTSKIWSFTPDEQKIFSAVLPDKFDFTSLVIQLDQLVQKHNFIINSLRINPSPAAVGGDSAKAKNILINLKISGGEYQDIKGILADLEGSAMIFDVTSLSLPTGKSFTYDLNLATYYYPDN
ncbi:MAG: hypothetical protein WC516_00405 [Patescibacteria group bacterium]